MKMLSTKKRLLIANFLFLGLIGVGVITIGLRVINIYNIRDPSFFDTEDTYVKYEYNDGRHEETLEFKVTDVKDAYSKFKYSYRDDSGSYEIDDDGYFKDKRSYQSIFWIHIAEEEKGGSELRLRELVGEEYKVYDPIGILGGSNGTYTLEITGWMVYWPSEEDQISIHGAQHSLTFKIFDGNNLAAEGFMDTTCGLIFEMKIGSADRYRSLRIIDTNYVISRNRLSAIMAALMLTIIMPIFAYLVMSKVDFWKFHLKIKDKKERLEMATLVGCGMMVLLLDFLYDIWFYTVVTFGITVLFHVAATGVLLIVCYKKEYGIRCAIPSVMELLFIGLFYYIDPQLIGAYLGFFMGLNMMFICMLFASGAPRELEKKSRDIMRNK